MALTATRRIAGAAAAFGALALLASRTGGEGGLARADRVAFENVRARRSRAGTVVAQAVSALARRRWSTPYSALPVPGAAPRIGWRRAFAPCLVVAGGAAARRRLSRVIARQRPPAEAWLTVPEGYSLPSKHTTLAVLAVGACVRTLGMPRVVSAASPLLAATAVGASRIYLGVHWPADVVAGWLFAEGWLCLVGPGRRAVWR